MTNSDSVPRSKQSPFTLLAVTALAISNLLVGVLQGNTALVLASSALSGGFAYVYAVRSGMIGGLGVAKRLSQASDAGPTGDAMPSSNRRFQLWLFLGVIFVMMPAILLFLQTIER